VLLPEEEDVLLPCFNRACEVEETTSLSKQEFEDPLEVTLASALPAYEEKETIIYTNVLIKEPLHMVDEHIYTFIQIGRRGWDLGCFIFTEILSTALKAPLG
jgi:hypothetical protein